MIASIRRAGALSVLLLGLAGGAWAADADSSAAPIGHTPGRGSIGGQIGGSLLAGNADYSKAAQPRFSFSGHFRYVISESSRWQLSPTYTWAAYANSEDIPFTDPNNPSDTKKDQVLTQMAGASIQYQMVWGRGQACWHLGAGPGVYRVWVQNRRKVLKDPLSKALHQGLHLGATAEMGYERFLKSLPNTSLEVTGAWHAAYARDDDKYPLGFNGNPMFAEIRVGGHYYFAFDRSKKSEDAGPGDQQ